MRSRKRSHRGSALIEFAGSLILLTGVFAGIFQIGFTLSSYNALVNAVRTGARYASLQGGVSSQDNADMAKKIKNLVVYGELAPAESAKPVIPGLETEHVNLTLGPSTATVSIRGFKLDSLFSQMKLDGRPSVTFPLTSGAAK